MKRFFTLVLPIALAFGTHTSQAQNVIRADGTVISSTPTTTTIAPVVYSSSTPVVTSYPSPGASLSVGALGVAIGTPASTSYYTPYYGSNVYSNPYYRSNVIYTTPTYSSYYTPTYSGYYTPTYGTYYTPASDGTAIYSNPGVYYPTRTWGIRRGFFRWR